MKQTCLSRAVIALILAVSLLCIPGFIFAFPGGDDNEHKSPVMEFFYEFFDITEEQQAALEELREETFEEIKPLISEMRELDDQFEDTLLAETIDTEEAARLIDEMVALKAEIFPITANAKVEAAQILTPEQRADISDVKGDISDFIDYILAYPELENLKDKYSERIIRAIMDSRLEDLELTEEQKTALIELRNETHDEIEPIDDILDDLEDQFSVAILAEPVNTEEAARLIAEMIDPMSQIERIKLNSQVEAAQILTPEQRQILLEKKQEKQRKRELFDRDRDNE